MKKVINRVFKTYYNIRGARLNYSISNAEKVQSSLLDYLIDSGSITEFGKLHNFEEIENYEDFKNQSIKTVSLNPLRFQVPITQ